MAVCPPAEVLDEVEGLVAVARRAQGGLRWTSRAQWHLTLLFLGPVAALAPVSVALEGLSGLPPARFGLGGAGAFPSVRRGRALWLGAAEGGEALAALAAAVAGALGPLGYAPDRSRFRPHLTVARLKAPGDMAAAVAALGSGPVGPAWTVDELVLFESRLGRDGAKYEPRQFVRLGRPGKSSIQPVWGPMREKPL